MHSKAVVVVMSGIPLEDFKSRVDAVFGALDTTHEAALPSRGWSLSEKQVLLIHSWVNMTAKTVDDLCLSRELLC